MRTCARKWLTCVPPERRGWRERWGWGATPRARALSHTHAHDTQLADRVQTSPEVELAAAAFLNTTADPKLLAAEFAVDAARAKEAKLGPSPFCKAAAKCADPAVAVLSESVNLLSAYLTVNIDNMGPNPTLAAVAAANGVPQAPVNSNTKENSLDDCTQKNITEYVTGHTRALDNTTKMQLNVYTEWIAVGLDDPGATCQRDADTGPSCAVVCARRGMMCDPCAMKASTADYNAFSWAVTQAGDSSLAKICTPEPGFATASGAGTGYFGYLCGTSEDDNFVLYSCNLPNYDQLRGQDEAWTDACQVPTWRVGRDVFPGTDSVGAQGGALCYCTGTSIVPPA